MVLPIGHDILGPVRVVLQEWHSADEVHAGAERHKHRPPVAVTHKASSDLIPAAHRAARRNAGVVGMAEPHLAAGPAGDALGNGRTAVLLECGRVEYAIGDALALLALSDTLADFLGMKLQAHVRLAWAHAVPLPKAHHAAARENAGAALADQRIVVLHDRPPADAERRGRAPVH